MQASTKSRQFKALYKIFLLRIIDFELLSADGDLSRLLGQFLALFAGISFLLSLQIMLVGGESEPLTASVSHTLISTTILVAGIVAALSWDSILPDRHDLYILSPLPLSPLMIFSTKLAAAGAALASAILALNIFTGIVWPPFFAQPGGIIAILHCFAIYWLTTLAAAAFSLCLVLAVQGCAIQLLPRTLFLRLSPWLQTLLFCLFVCTYILEPSLEMPATLVRPENQQLLDLLPSYWFWGLFHRLRGTPGIGTAVYAALARRAGISVVATAGIAIVAEALFYFRSLGKILESPEIPPSRRWFTRFTLPVSPLQRAVTLFAVRALLRSRQHRVILSFYYGVALAIAIADSNVLFLTADSVGGPGRLQTPLFAATILMAGVSVGAIRVLAAIPIAPKANWLFRMTEIPLSKLYLDAIRSAWMTLSILPVLLASAIFLLFLLPLLTVLQHAVVLLIFGMLLVECALIGFRKIPFTCPYLPGKGNMQYLFWACAFVLIPLVNAAARLESSALSSPWSYGTLLLVLTLALALIRRYNTSRAVPPASIQFDESLPLEILTLQLK